MVESSGALTVRQNLMMRYVSLPPTHTIIHLPTRRLLGLAATRIDRRSGEYGVEMCGPTRSVLSLLATTCPSQREFASALRVTVQTMSATLERLEQLEYVERSRDPYDRLRSLCRLTEKDRLALSEVDTDESPLLDDDRRDELLRQLLIELITRHPDRDGVDAHNAIADHE